MAKTSHGEVLDCSGPYVRIKLHNIDFASMFFRRPTSSGAAGSSAEFEEPTEVLSGKVYLRIDEDELAEIENQLEAAEWLERKKKQNELGFGHLYAADEFSQTVTIQINLKDGEMADPEKMSSGKVIKDKDGNIISEQVSWDVIDFLYRYRFITSSYPDSIAGIKINTI